MSSKIKFSNLVIATKAYFINVMLIGLISIPCMLVFKKFTGLNFNYNGSLSATTIIWNVANEVIYYLTTSYRKDFDLKINTWSKIVTYFFWGCKILGLILSFFTSSRNYFILLLFFYLLRILLMWDLTNQVSKIIESQSVEEKNSSSI